jgi:hypothetical protein
MPLPLPEAGSDTRYKSTGGEIPGIHSWYGVLPVKISRRMKPPLRFPIKIIAGFFSILFFNKCQGQEARVK